MCGDDFDVWYKDPPYKRVDADTPTVWPKDFKPEKLDPEKFYNDVLGESYKREEDK